MGISIKTTALGLSVTIMLLGMVNAQAAEGLTESLPGTQSNPSTGNAAQNTTTPASTLQAPPGSLSSLNLSASGDPKDIVAVFRHMTTKQYLGTTIGQNGVLVRAITTSGPSLSMDGLSGNYSMWALSSARIKTGEAQLVIASLDPQDGKTFGQLDWNTGSASGAQTPAQDTIIVSDCTLTLPTAQQHKFNITSVPGAGVGNSLVTISPYIPTLQTPVCIGLSLTSALPTITPCTDPRSYFNLVQV